MNINDIEDEYYFILVCPFYTHLRQMYIPKYFSQQPGMHKFIILLNCDKKQVLIKLALYCLKAFEIRDTKFST